MSNDSELKGSDSAEARHHSTETPVSFAWLCAARSIASERSTPTTCASLRAARMEYEPSPQPRSSTRFPLRSPARSKTVFCSIRSVIIPSWDFRQSADSSGPISQEAEYDG